MNAHNWLAEQEHRLSMLLSQIATVAHSTCIYWLFTVGPKSSTQKKNVGLSCTVTEI